jgi:hypothetical protein
VLMARRDKVVRTWINAVNPLANFRLAEDGTLTFDNAAVDAKVPTPAGSYVISWSRFDNASNTHAPASGAETQPSTTARAPRGLEASQSVAASVNTPVTPPGLPLSARTSVEKAAAGRPSDWSGDEPFRQRIVLYLFCTCYSGFESFWRFEQLKTRVRC